ncbi:MAG TPA: 30S ribosomal protein S6 [Candidatus Paceibacterota bacterium]
MKSMSDEENIVTGEETEARVYELSYLLVPTISEENVGATFTNLKELVSSFGGASISDEIPRMTELAYTMQKTVANTRSKFNNAYFGWMKFSMNREKVLELKKKLDLRPDVIRFLILKTVKENTIAAKRYVGRDSAYRKPNADKPKEGEEVVPINKEEIDKEIDAMVAV